MADNDNPEVDDQGNPIVDPNVSTGAEESKPGEGEEETPNKFEGKSLEDVVKSHKELERKLGQQGDEIGKVKASAAEKQARMEQDGYTFDEEGNVISGPEAITPPPQDTSGGKQSLVTGGIVNEAARREEIQRRIEEQGLDEGTATELVDLRINQELQSYNLEGQAYSNFEANKQTFIAQNPQYQGLEKVVDSYYGSMPYHQRTMKVIARAFSMAAGSPENLKKIASEAEARGRKATDTNLAVGGQHDGGTGNGSGEPQGEQPTSQDMANAKSYGIPIEKWMAQKKTLAQSYSR